MTYLLYIVHKTVFIENFITRLVGKFSINKNSKAFNFLRTGVFTDQKYKIKSRKKYSYTSEKIFIIIVFFGFLINFAKTYLLNF